MQWDIWLPWNQLKVQQSGRVLSQICDGLVAKANLTATVGTSKQQRLFPSARIDPNDVIRNLRFVQERKHKGCGYPSRYKVNWPARHSGLDVVFYRDPVQQRDVINPNKAALQIERAIGV